MTATAPKRHRCGRCGGEFDCTAPGCMALYDVLPTMVRAGDVVEHECARSKMSLLEALKKIASGCTTDPAATAQEALDRWPRVWGDDIYADVYAALRDALVLVDTRSPLASDVISKCEAALAKAGAP